MIYLHMFDIFTLLHRRSLGFSYLVILWHFNWCDRPAPVPCCWNLQPPYLSKPILYRSSVCFIRSPRSDCSEMHLTDFYIYRGLPNLCICIAIILFWSNWKSTTTFVISIVSSRAYILHFIMDITQHFASFVSPSVQTIFYSCRSRARLLAWFNFNPSMDK